jgi:hypothetical protein
MIINNYCRKFHLKYKNINFKKVISYQQFFSGQGILGILGNSILVQRKVGGTNFQISIFNN